MFHLRPMCVAAVGALVGTLLIRSFPPPYAYLAALPLLAVAAAAAMLKKRVWFLLFLFMAMALINAGRAYPADGSFPQRGPVIRLPDSPAYEGLVAVREKIGGRIEAIFQENGAVAKGMLLGDKASVDDDTMEAFGNAGILHLMAVSGLHVSVLAGAFSLMIRRNAWVRLLLTGLFCGGYTALTAFSPSVIRASLMLLYGLAAVPFCRRADGPTSLAFAFLAVLAISPFALFRTGFQLSFCAVYGLILLTPVLEKPMARLGKRASTLLASSAAVTIATVPAMALAFREVSFLSLLTNLIVLPLAPVFLVPAFVGVAVSFLSMPLGNLVVLPARLALNAIVAVADIAGRWVLPLHRPGTAAYLLYLAAILCCSRLCMRDGTKRALYGAVALAGSFLCWLLF